MPKTRFHPEQEKAPSLVPFLSRVLRTHFLVFLVGAYVLAAIFPAPGKALRGGVLLFDFHIPVVTVLLALMLFHAGLSLDVGQILHRDGSAAPLLRCRRVGLLGMGLLVDWLLPLGLVLMLVTAMPMFADSLNWRAPGGLSPPAPPNWLGFTSSAMATGMPILVGLALVAAMPAANSSVAWSQNANGSVAISLGLVFGSTLLSAVLAPLSLRTVAWWSPECSVPLLRLAHSYAGVFVLFWVILPSLGGMLVRGWVGPERIRVLLPHIKLINACALLILNYANASVSLPRVLDQPEPDWLLVVGGLASGFVLATFAAGAWMSRWLSADAAQRTAFTFGLGMNNNGIALVLATQVLPVHEGTHLTIILCTLAQHLVAGGVHRGGLARAEEHEPTN